MRKNHYVLASVLSLAFTVSGWAQDATPRWRTRNELEAHSRELDRQAVELQHAVMAARHDGDREALKRAEEKLKSTQEERGEALRALGQLP